MISCAVYGCTNSTATNTDPTVQYYYFPKHPVIAQQWITACWRADPIDLNTEYKLDYLGNYTRMLKYFAVPTLYLPNPHTPVIMKATLDQPVTINNKPLNPHEIKEIMVYEVQSVSDQASNSNFESNPVKDYMEIETQQPALLNSDIKFEVQNQLQVNEITNIAKSQDDDMEIETQQPALLNSDIKFEVQNQLQVNEITNIAKSQDDEKYKHISDRQHLEALKNDNIALRHKVEKLEAFLKKLQSQVSDKSQAVKTKDEELKKIMQQYDMLHRASMTLVDQKSILSKVFSESQIKILSGKKKIYWSNDDMAMGYTIRHLSNKRCYMYLSKNLSIPLPALSSIKRWSTLKKNEFEKEEKKDDSKFEDEDSE